MRVSWWLSRIFRPFFWKIWKNQKDISKLTDLQLFKYNIILVIFNNIKNCHFKFFRQHRKKYPYAVLTCDILTFFFSFSFIPLIHFLPILGWPKMVMPKRWSRVAFWRKNIWIRGLLLMSGCLGRALGVIGRFITKISTMVFILGEQALILLYTPHQNVWPLLVSMA